MNTPTRRTSVLRCTLGALLTALSATAGAGCHNVFKDLSTKNTNDAYFADAKDAINGRDYTLALTKLLATTPEYQERRDVILTVAGAYAGRCGLDFLKVVRNIVDTPNTRLFPLLLLNFRGAATGNIADCGLAQTWVRKLAPTNDFTQLTADENLFLAIASLSKIGAILATYADLDHDGAVDAAFDACNTTKLSDARKRDIGASLNLALASLDASHNTQVAGSPSGVASTCAALPAAQNFCGIYDPAGFSAQMVQLLGGLTGSQDLVGLGSCTNTFAMCVCP